MDSSCANQDNKASHSAHQLKRDNSSKRSVFKVIKNKPLKQNTSGVIPVTNGTVYDSAYGTNTSVESGKEGKTNIQGLFQLGSIQNLISREKSVKFMQFDPLPNTNITVSQKSKCVKVQEKRKTKLNKILRQKIRRPKINGHASPTLMSNNKLVFDPDFITEMSFRKLKKLKKLSVQRIADFKARGSNSIKRSTVNYKLGSRFLIDDTLEKPTKSPSHSKLQSNNLNQKFKQSDNIALLISQLKRDLNLNDSSLKNSNRGCQNKSSKKLKNIRIEARKSGTNDLVPKILISTNDAVSKFFDNDPCEVVGRNSLLRTTGTQNSDIKDILQKKKSVDIIINNAEKNLKKRNFESSLKNKNPAPNSVKNSTSKCQLISVVQNHQIGITSRNNSKYCVLPSVPALKSNNRKSQSSFPENTSMKNNIGAEETYVIKKVFDTSNILTFVQPKRSYKKPLVNMRTPTHLFTKFEKYKKDNNFSKNGKETKVANEYKTKNNKNNNSAPKFVVGGTKKRVEIKMPF
ncbi:unnamed protein product [Moneuplotes crassus]|uniref:Uncharacterized protein n=1 Tax=Euplotes crassus TaxID=5936 RepID=A0AAD1U4B1_EUPCR|nr:unnamed protein product [Moneuplotes crassus]